MINSGKAGLESIPTIHTQFECHFPDTTHIFKDLSQKSGIVSCSYLCPVAGPEFSVCSFKKAGEGAKKGWKGVIGKAAMVLGKGHVAVSNVVGIVTWKPPSP